VHPHSSHGYPPSQDVFSLSLKLSFKDSAIRTTDMTKSTCMCVYIVERMREEWREQIRKQYGKK
jgi:hypothetical protein